MNGRREARRKGGREGGAAGSTHPETRPGVVPTEQPSTQVTEAAAQAQSMMDENMILMQERGEKLDRMTYKTERMKKGAMDFAEAARALAERERTKKWWEF